MSEMTYGFIGVLLILSIFIIPALNQIKDYLKDIITLKKKENEMIASLHDKVMEIRNSVDDFKRQKKD